MADVAFACCPLIDTLGFRHLLTVPTPSWTTLQRIPRRTLQIQNNTGKPCKPLQAFAITVVCCRPLLPAQPLGLDLQVK
jgi:hypothetical protein